MLNSKTKKYYPSDAMPIVKKSPFRKAVSYASGYLYVLPVLIGIFIFTLVPMAVSLFHSFTTYDSTSFNPNIQFTLDNYARMFTPERDGGAFAHSLFITFRYALIMVPLNLIGSYFIALLINRLDRGSKTITVLLYLPALIPAIAGTFLWANITSTQSYGYINQILELFGLGPYPFYSKPETVFPTIIMLSLSGWGTSSIMWTAQFKNIPKELYEAAEIDGAGHVGKLWNVTLPMSTPMLFYMLITSIIGALQIFGGFYPLLDVYPASSREFSFLVVKIYREVYDGYGLSYACAMSWILFVIIGILTLTIFKTSKWVYYGEEK